MNVLLDTCALLALPRGELPNRAAKALRAAREASVSVVSAWEIAIKAAAGKVRLAGSPVLWFAGLTERNALREIPLDARTACAAAVLPRLHRDLRREHRKVSVDDDTLVFFAATRSLSRGTMGTDQIFTRAGRSALLVVDVQKDFCPGGALAVPNGDQVVPALNRYLDQAAAQGVHIYASRDWHPRITRHFKDYGGQWPPHCIQDTDGARFHSDLRLPPAAVVISKGQDPDSAGYSALEGRTSDGRPFADDLREHSIDHLYVGGLATDYCVRSSVLDALRAGFRVTVLRDAVAGIDARPGDSGRALRAMEDAGAVLLPTSQS